MRSQSTKALMKQLLLFLILPISVSAQKPSQQMSVGSIHQEANCAIAAVQGSNNTINCPGLDPKILRIIQQQFKERLNERDVSIDHLTREVNDWKDKFLLLNSRLSNTGINDRLRKKAEDLLDAGKLEAAGVVLDEVIADEETAVDQAAKAHFDRAALYELQSDKQMAFKQYKRAFEYRPDNPDYGLQYALRLSDLKEYDKAIPILRDVVIGLRNLAQADPTQLRILALSLSELGEVYEETHQLKESADTYMEALHLYRDLVRAEPQYYLIDLELAMDRLGFLLMDNPTFDVPINKYCSGGSATIAGISVPDPATFASLFKSECSQRRGIMERFVQDSKPFPQVK